MNGVEMCSAIREKLPDASIVFMSGFSDKEYLKSAIRLSAVSYVEKPIDPQELIAALRTAVERQMSLASSREAVANTRHRLDISYSAMKNQVALDLVQRRADRAKIEEQMCLVYPGIDRAGWWVVLIASILETPAREANTLDSVCALLEGRFGAGEEAVKTLVGRMDDHCVMAHLNAGGGDFDSACAAAADYCYKLRDTLKSVCGFQLVMGKPVPSLEALPDSFQYAQENRQRGFFYQPQSVLIYRDTPSPVCALTAEMLLPLQEALRRRDEERANELTYHLFQAFYQGEGTPEGALKHFILRLMLMIRQEAAVAGGESAPGGGAEAETRRGVFGKQFLYELEALVQAEVRAFFAADAGQADKPVLALRLRRYIDENFCDPQLSLASLAASFGVSESHLCVVYRKTFGVTLNQRITGLRIEKAQKLLLGGDRKVKEIAEETGYPDCNYFIKLFKKHTGVTPQEYRGH
jgi:two-component system response regulator YesN